MTKPSKLITVLSCASAVAMLASVTGFVGPASANGKPVTPEELKHAHDVFMDAVKKGDRLFHGDPVIAKEMGVTLTTTGMSCAMCHPMASDTHPFTYPKFQQETGQFFTLRDMINWCIAVPNTGTALDLGSEAMKDLEAYITWSNTGSVLVPGRY